MNRLPAMRAALASAALIVTPALGCQGILDIEDGTLQASAAGSSGSSGASASNNKSCSVLSADCGPSEGSDCCARDNVPGGRFYRSFDNKTFTDTNFPATVSDFALDTYEVTVGRFRKFVAEYSPNMMTEGAGRNPNNPSDPGWDPDWNALLPVDATALSNTLACDASAPFAPTFWTDSTGTNENRPVACVSWYEAFAFCVWDGGRLPTEAEWNYAAAGGGDHKPYPWGPASPDDTYAVADLSQVRVPTAPEKVGSKSPKGDGKWSQSDLAGNLSEWNLDWYSSPYPPGECNDCANTAWSYGASHVTRGGSFWDDASVLLSAFRSVWSCSEAGAPPSPEDPPPPFPSFACRSSLVGFRCARSTQ